MSMQITHIRLAVPLERHEVVAWLRWRNDSDGSDGESSTPTLVRWLDNGGSVHIGDGDQRIEVLAVHPEHGEPYLQAYADDAWTDALLTLPRF